MEVQNLRFCQECGREILDDYGFCPACGAFYDNRRKAEQLGSANVRTEPQTGPTEEQEAARIAYQTYMQQLSERIYINNMRLTLVMLVVWVALSFILAACLFSGNETLLSWVKASFVMGGSPVHEATILVFSGGLALISTVLCALRKYWYVAFYSCFASTLLSATLILFDDRICIYFFLCGLLASLRVRNLRPMFE